MHKHLLAIALTGTLTGTLATPARGQTTEPSRFGGVRIEALTGYDRLRAGGNADSGADGGSNSISGLTYGVGAGFDFDLGGVVAGVEGEYSDSTGKRKDAASLEGTDISAGLSLGRDLYVGGRIGFPVGASTLIYAKGGYTNASIAAFADIDGERFEDKAHVGGFRVGAGIEQMFGANAYGKLEYRYSRYRKLDLAGDLSDEADAGGSSKIGLDRHQVVVGFGLRF